MTFNSENVGRSVVSDSLKPHSNCQAPLSMGFPRQEYWSGLSFPSQGNLPHPGIKTKSHALEVNSSPSKPPGKCFLSEQRKEVEERLEISSRKLGVIKGIFHARMGTIKDGKGKDLTETEEIKKRTQEYTEELYKKGLKDVDNHHGEVTHLEPDILEYKVKWA